MVWSKDHSKSFLTYMGIIFFKLTLFKCLVFTAFKGIRHSWYNKETSEGDKVHASTVHY